MLDQAESIIATELVQEDFPVAHGFIPGFYVRTIFMPANRVITSAIHKTTHPFFIPTGDVIVGSEKDGEIRYQGPVHGITTPGTRRILRTLADTVWTTYHRTNKTNLEEIIADLIEPHVNPYLPKDFIPCHSRS